MPGPKSVTPIAVRRPSGLSRGLSLIGVTLLRPPGCRCGSAGVTPFKRVTPCRSLGGLKSVTPVADLPLHWRPQKCDPYRRFPSSMRPKPQFGDPYRRFVDPADPDEIRWARYCDTYRTIRLVCRSAGLSPGLSWVVRCWVVLGCPAGLSWVVLGCPGISRCAPLPMGRTVVLGCPAAHRCRWVAPPLPIRRSLPPLILS